MPSASSCRSPCRRPAWPAAGGRSGTCRRGEEVQERGSTLRYEPGWRLKMIINGFGAVCTAVVTVVFAVTKFHDGAWVVLILIPALVAIFFAIHRHYRALARPALAGPLRPAAAHRAPPRDPADQRRAPGHAGGAATTPGCCPTTSRPCTSRSTPTRPEKLQEQVGGCGARACAWSSSDSPYRLLVEPLLRLHRRSGRPAPAQRDRSPSWCRSSCPRAGGTTCCTRRRRRCCGWPCCSSRGIVITDVPYQVA